jgi:hypothetical protein
MGWADDWSSRPGWRLEGTAATLDRQQRCPMVLAVEGGDPHGRGRLTAGHLGGVDAEELEHRDADAVGDQHAEGERGKNGADESKG